MIRVQKRCQRSFGKSHFCGIDEHPVNNWCKRGKGVRAAHDLSSGVLLLTFEIEHNCARTWVEDVACALESIALCSPSGISAIVLLDATRPHLVELSPETLNLLWIALHRLGSLSIGAPILYQGIQEDISNIGVAIALKADHRTIERGSTIHGCHLLHRLVNCLSPGYSNPSLLFESTESLSRVGFIHDVCSPTYATAPSL